MGAFRVGGLRGRFNGAHRRYVWLVRVFPGAPAPLLVELAGGVGSRRYRRGEVIVAEGEPADRFFVVTSGEAEAVARVAERDVYVGTFGPGASFGEVGLLTSRPRNATVRRRSSGPAAGERRSAPRADAAPLPAWTRLCKRVNPRLMHYNRLIALVLALNVLVLWYGVSAGWWSSRGANLAAIALAAQANFALAIVFRQSYVINFIGWIATRAPTSWPLRVRWMLGKWFHFGGLHVGAAIAGTLWYCAFLGSLTLDLARGRVGVSVAIVVASTSSGCSSSSSL